jgi:hypothetical protein
MKRNELPENERGLITIMDRFVCDEVFMLLKKTSKVG